MYPGWGYGWVGPGGAIPVPYPAVPGPIFSHILGIRPYPWPNEGNSEVFTDVSQIWPQIDLQIDLQMASE